jgi:glutamate synthase domain-containing protein 1
MCGIVGLFLKDARLESRLGSLLETMLIEMTERGPDSAGFAVYRNPAPAGGMKISLYDPSPNPDWKGVASALSERFSAPIGFADETGGVGDYTVMTVPSDPEVQSFLAQHFPSIGINGVGDKIEVYKDVGLPAAVASRFHLSSMSGSHALGHTRMATESAVTTQHSHPFATGQDLCLVHNGSLSNHNRLREDLRRRGINFQTDNDSEVAAGYLTDKLAQGVGLEDALTSALKDLDGFFTFAVGTKDGFAVIRDPVACKPAVLAETDQWVAMSSEYRSIAVLPGSDDARVWEPKAGEVYCWGRS